MKTVVLSHLINISLKSWWSLKICAVKLNHHCLESKEFILLVFHGHGHFLHKRKKIKQCKDRCTSMFTLQWFIYPKENIICKIIKGFSIVVVLRVWSFNIVVLWYLHRLSSNFEKRSKEWQILLCFFSSKTDIAKLMPMCGGVISVKQWFSKWEPRPGGTIEAAENWI